MKNFQNQRRQQRRLLLEACEPRQLMTNGFGPDVGENQTSNFNEVDEVTESVADFSTIELDSAARAVEVWGTQYGDEATVTRLPSSIALAGPSTGRIQVEISSYFNNETLVFDEEDFDLIRFHGEAGSDHFENLTDVASEAIGGEGSDTLLGGSGRDTLSGGTGDDLLKGNEGADELKGGRGDDELKGGRGADTLEGDGGADRMFGNRGQDTLLGGPGNDYLEGGENDDQLDGEDGDDVLFGGSGEDTLTGGSGNDGLLGGGGVDQLTGGPDADRFLMPTVVEDIGGIDVELPEDVVNSLRNEDAILYFADAGTQWVNLLNTDLFYAAGQWTDEEILAVDEALANLMKLTGNNALLEAEDGTAIKFYRAGDEYTMVNLLPVPSVTASGWNSNDGTITFTHATFDTDADGVLDADHNWIHQVVYHELGHNWDTENADWQEWLDMSGWTQSALEAVYNGPICVSGDGEWFHDCGADFIRQYSAWNPREHFATTFAYYVMQEMNETYNGATATSADISEQLDFMEDFVESLV